MVGVSPGIQDNLGIAVVGNQRAKIPLGKEVSNRLRLGLGKGGWASVDIRGREWAGSLVIITPLVSVVPVEVNS